MGSWSPDVIGENLHECGSGVSRFISHVPVDEVARQHETPCVNVTAGSRDSMLPLSKKKKPELRPGSTCGGFTIFSCEKKTENGFSMTGFGRWDGTKSGCSDYVTMDYITQDDKNSLLTFFGGTRFMILHLVNDIQKESQ